MRSYPMPMPTICTNAAQEDEALKNTREACAKVLGLCRELNLPASAFDVVMMTYHSQLAAIGHRDAYAREAKIANQMNAILARRPQPPGAFDNIDFGAPMVRPLRGDPYEQKLIAMSEAELDAEYQRVVVDSQKP